MADTLFTVRSQFDPKGTDEALKGFGSVQGAIGNLGKAFSVFGRVVSAITLKNIVIFKAITTAMGNMVERGRAVVEANRQMALETGFSGDAMESLRHQMGLAVTDSKMLSAAVNGDADALSRLIGRSREAREALSNLGVTIEDLANQDPRKIYATLAAATAAMGGTPGALPDYLAEGIAEEESWTTPEMRRDYEAVAARVAHARQQSQNRLVRAGRGFLSGLAYPFQLAGRGLAHGYDVATQGYAATFEEQARIEAEQARQAELDRVLALPTTGQRPRHDVEMAVRMGEAKREARELEARRRRGNELADQYARTIRIFDNTTAGITAGDRVETIVRSGQVVGGELLTPDGR